MNIYVPGKGQIGARIVILGEAPSYEEEAQLEPFVGPSGKFLNQCLQQAGINRSECWLTNVSKYMVVPQVKEGRKIPFKERAKMAGIDLDQQISELRTELWHIKPNIIIALGASALWALTGKSPIANWRGSILSGMGHKVIGTYHPAHFLHMDGEVTGYWQKQVMLFDLKRAKEESFSSEITLPSRLLHVCKSASQLRDFIRRHEGQKHPSVDIEAYECIPACIGLAFNHFEGFTVPLWNKIGKTQVSDISDSELALIWIMLAEFLYAQEPVGQNFGYDRDKIRRLGLIIRRLYSDVMLKSFSINPELPKNLAFNTSIYTKEPFYKNEGMYEGSVNDLLIGCARDACVTKEIDVKMDLDLDELGAREYFENFVMKLHDLYLYIENNGIKVDESIREDILTKYVKWDEKLNYDLFNIAGDVINVQSPKQVSSLLYGNWKLPYKGGAGEDVLTMILNGRHANALQKKAIEIILTDRRVKKTIGTYLLTPTDYDGRMRTSYFVCLETGRSSTNQQETPIRPYIEVERTNAGTGKREKKKVAMGCAFQTLTKHGDIGPEVRTMYVPDDDEVFIQADSAQAEARVTALLASDEEMLKRYDEIDIHAWTASLFFGRPIEEFDKKIIGYEKPERFIGKMLRHAGERGMKRRRAATEVNTNAKKYGVNIEISEGEADNHLRMLYATYPKLQSIYFAEVIKCLERDRRLCGPVPFGIKANKGGVRTFFERWGDELFRMAFSYLPQRAVTDNTKCAALRIHEIAPWIKLLVESHDSLLASVKISRANEAALIMREEFERPIDFSGCSLPRGFLSIPCEIEIGYNYKDLSKFKLHELTV